MQIDTFLKAMETIAKLLQVLPEALLGHILGVKVVQYGISGTPSPVIAIGVAPGIKDELQHFLKTSLDLVFSNSGQGLTANWAFGENKILVRIEEETPFM